jgi:PAS domain S-box-containing protein
MSDDQGGDPACWSHLFDEEASPPISAGSHPAPAPGREPAAEPDEPTLARLVEAMADAVVIADVEGLIVYWNGAAERIFGWTAADAVGRSLDLIIPDRQRPAHWEGYQRVMATGNTRYGTELLRVPALHPDGQRRSIAFTVTLLTDPDGTVTGIAAVVRDETDRWAEERQLRAELTRLRQEVAGADPGRSAP